MSEADTRGRKLLEDLAKTVQEKVNPSGEPVANRRGLKMIERLARDLTGPAAMPGLKLSRDAPHRFRLQRPPKNAAISVEWQRDIGCIVMTSEKHGNARVMVRYVFDDKDDHWRRFDEVGDLYEDLVATLVDCLYPEGRAP